MFNGGYIGLEQGLYSSDGSVPGTQEGLFQGRYPHGDDLAGPKQLILPPVPGYSFWFRADGLENGVSNSYGITDGFSNLQQWNDLGGSNIVAVQSVAGINQPALIDNGINIGVRRRKFIRYFGSPEIMNINNAGAITNNISGITIFIIGKINTGGSVQIPIYFSTNASAGSSRADIRSSAGNLWQIAGRRLDTDSVQTVSGGSSTVGYKRVCGAIDYANALGYIYENELLVNSGVFSTPGNTPSNNSVQVAVGGSNGTNQINGNLPEVLVYPRKLTDNEIKLVQLWQNDFYLMAA